MSRFALSIAAVASLVTVASEVFAETPAVPLVACSAQDPEPQAVLWHASSDRFEWERVQGHQCDLRENAFIAVAQELWTPLSRKGQDQ